MPTPKPFKPVDIKNQTARQATQHVRNITRIYRDAPPEAVHKGRIWFPVAHDHAAKIGRGDVDTGAGMIASLSPSTEWELEPGQRDLPANAGGNLAQAYHLAAHPLRGHQVAALDQAQRAHQAALGAVKRSEKVYGKGQAPAAVYEQYDQAKRAHMAQRQEHLGGTPLNRQTTQNVLRAQAIYSGATPESVLPMDVKTGHFYSAIKDPSHPTAVPIDTHAHDIAVGRKLPWKTDRGLQAKSRYDHFVNSYAAATKLVREVNPSTTMAVAWTHHRDQRGGERGA